MTKILSILTALVLGISLIVVPVSAAGTGTLGLTGGQGKQGDTVTLNVNLNSNPGLITMRFTVSWGEGLELTRVSNSGVLADWTQPAPTISSPYTLRWADSLSTVNNTATGKIATLTFKIKDNATVGNKTVALTFSESRDATGGRNTFTGATATIKVSCKTHSYGDWSTNGATNHKHTCSACGDVAYENHKWDAGTQTKPADCKEAGNKKYTCTVCGEIKNEAISKTNGHTYGQYTVKTPATCTTTGTKTRTCSTCQKVDTQTIAKLDHKMGAWKTTKEATCEAKGTKVRECERDNCNHKETQDIAALGHKFSNPTVTKEPTCTETGIETGTCTRCKKETTNTIKAKGHSFDKWEDVKAATCTEAGEQKRKCKNCDHTETKKVDALGHDFENPTVITEPTIATTGIAEGKCKRCGEVTREIIPCSFKDETTGVEIATQEGVFQEGTQIKVEAIAKEHASFENIKTALKEIASEFVAYDVSAMLNNAVVQPNGTVSVSFKIPEGFGKNVAVYYIGDDGVSEKIESVISEDGASITAQLTHFSYYVVCDLSSVESQETDIPAKDTEEKENNMMIYIIIGVLVLLIVAGVVIFIIAKKKKVVAEISEADDHFTIE